MEPFWEDENEEEIEHRIQEAKKTERMKREKRWEKERRRRIKRLLKMGSLGVAAVIIIAVFAGFEGKQESTDEKQTVKIEKTEIEAKTEEKTQAAEKSSEQGSDSNTFEISAGITEGITTGKAAGMVSDAVKRTTSAYNFEETADTVTIYSEEVVSTNAILIDESTDTIVASKGAKERISPASMTKVLTVLVAAECLTEEQLDDTMTITLEMTDYAYVNDCSAVGFLDGEAVTVRDLFYGTILPSGGDAALGLATYVAGSHEAFVDMINEKLEKLGLAESAHFTNCVGLYDEEHYCTVYDMAVIMKAALENDLCREILTTRTYTTSSTVQHPEGITISNWFIRRIEDKDDETGGEVLGAKTGYVVQSKNCAVSYGTFGNNTPYICVTAGATSSWRCIYDHVEIYTRYVLKEEQ